jgi:hypothetical protein
MNCECCPKETTHLKEFEIADLITYFRRWMCEECEAEYRKTYQGKGFQYFEPTGRARVSEPTGGDGQRIAVVQPVL